MKNKHQLAIGSFLISLAIASVIYFPLKNSRNLIPLDLQVVQRSEQIPPFYEGIFRGDDIKSVDFLLSDPVVGVRAKPFFPEIHGLGPHDLLGFRNHNIPRVADIVVIGDSQTYGNNALLAENWPSELENHLHQKKARVYNMSAGGWSAPQYLEIFKRSVVFQPYIVVVALYSGNDAHESFRTVYSNSEWSYLLRDKDLKVSDLPSLTAPNPESDQWPVQFAGGIETIFTPWRRFISNDRSNTAVKAGWKIMEELLKELNQVAVRLGVIVYYTVIPTKEQVYSLRIDKESVVVPAEYISLVNDEEENVKELISKIESSTTLRYIDIIKPLQLHALSDHMIYPPDSDGHPLPTGYSLIGKILAEQVSSAIPDPIEDGVYRIEISDGKFLQILSEGDKLWIVREQDQIKSGKWKGHPLKDIPYRKVASRLVSGYFIQ